jgi:hypothetical protein
MNQSDRVRDAVPPRSRSRVVHVRGHAHAQVSIARRHSLARERRVDVTPSLLRDLSSQRDGAARETTRDGVSRDSRRRARARRARATRARARASARGRDDGRARCDDDDSDGDDDARCARWRGRATVPRDERRGEGGVGCVGARARERERERERGAGGVLVRPGQAVRE